MPRHDALLRGPPEEKRVIVVMPTWRKSLVGKEAGFGNRRLLEPSFARSEYAQRWKSVLHSRRLLKAASAAGHQLCFVPHKNIEPYLDFFDLPADVTVKVFGDGQPISPFFRQLSLFVTDFTSKAFDVAYLGKPLLYYQFDDERFFGGGHISRPGYFDYERDGFGPVCRDEDALVAAIESHLEGVPPNPIYRSRAEKAFPFRDGKCCERVFEAILALDRPHDSAA
jgi:CDP-glycerol glycerophosphotransferase (TagB/SpsB family)